MHNSFPTEPSRLPMAFALILFLVILLTGIVTAQASAYPSRSSEYFKVPSPALTDHSLPQNTHTFRHLSPRPLPSRTQRTAGKAVLFDQSTKKLQETHISAQVK